MLGVPPRLLRDGEGWAVETFPRLGTHNSTHVDAPWHYNSTIGGERGADASTSCRSSGSSRPGVVLDFTAKADGDAVDAPPRSRRSSRRVGHELAPLDIVLVRTGRDRFFDQPDYPALGCGVTAEATRWLYEQRRARDGHRRLGLGRAAAPPGPGASSATSPGSSGRPTRWTCRTARSSGCATSPRCRHRLHGRAASRCGSSAAAPGPARVVGIVPD